MKRTYDRVDIENRTRNLSFLLKINNVITAVISVKKSNHGDNYACHIHLTFIISLMTSSFLLFFFSKRIFLKD